MRRAVTPIVACVIVLLAGCDWVPRKVAMNDPRIQPPLKAAQSFDRPADGFTPKPRATDVLGVATDCSLRCDATHHC